jgi:hydrogenase maturation protease
MVNARPTPRVVVIGYGNPLRRDDGVGWRVAETIAQRWGERVTVLMGQQPVPEWAAVLAEADVAFIVDASVSVGPRVRLRRLPPATASEHGRPAHQLGPHYLVWLSQAIYGSAPVTYLLPLPAENLEFGEGLSAPTARAADQAVRLLDRCLSLTLRGRRRRCSSG